MEKEIQGQSYHTYLDEACLMNLNFFEAQKVLYLISSWRGIEVI